MANPIGQVLAAISSLIVLLIAYSIFGPMIDQVMAGLVMDALVDPGTTALAVNGNALLLTKDIIIMGIKVFSWFVVFAIFARLFIYLGFFTEEQGVY
jgi:hypothetical protein